MTKTTTFDDLLTVCIQDLYRAADAVFTNLPAIARHANDPALAALLERVTTEAGEARDGLTATDRHRGGDQNLWIAGILDDAARDTRSIAPGPLLDAAMIGATRKALAATIVSYQTAIAVAAALDQVPVADSLSDLHDAAVESDALLRDRLPQAGRRALGKSAQTSS